MKKRDALQKPKLVGYRSSTDEEIPLVGYAVLMAAYSSLFLLAHTSRTKTSEKNAQQFTPSEMLLLSLASYKFARIVTMSFIASPIRAAFTTRGISLKAGEVQDTPRGRGLQRAIGSLLTCPFCFNVWSVTGFVFLHSVAPRLFHRLGTVLTVAAAGDVLHLGYRQLRETVE